MSFIWWRDVKYDRCVYTSACGDKSQNRKANDAWTVIQVLVQYMKRWLPLFQKWFYVHVIVVQENV